MVHSTERATLVLDFLPELLEYLNEFSHKGLLVKPFWKEKFMIVSHQCFECERTITRIEAQENLTPLEVDFLEDLKMLARAFKNKGVKVGELYKRIFEDLQMLDLEVCLRNLFEVDTRQEGYLPENFFEGLTNAFVRHKLLNPKYEVNSVTYQQQWQEFHQWREDHRNSVYNVFAKMLAKYIASEESPEMEFRLPIIRSFLSIIKSYILPIFREGLDIKHAWEILFGNGPLTFEDRGDNTDLLSHFEELLAKIERRYRREFLDAERIFRDVAAKLTQPNNEEELSTLLSRTIEEVNSFEDFLHIIVVWEITRFINWLSSENVEHLSFNLNVEVTQLEKMNWDFYADFLYLAFSYHRRGLRNLRGCYETFIFGPTENIEQNKIGEEFSSLGQEFASDLIVYFSEYEEYGFSFKEIWRYVSEELELLDELEREGFLLPVRVKFKTPLFDNQFRIEKFMRSDSWRAIGFFIALTIYDIDNIEFEVESE